MTQKYREPFRPTPIIQRYVDRARSGAAETKALAERIVTNQAISKALNTIERAVDQGQLDLPTIEPLIQLFEQHQGRSRLREFRITPQITILRELEGYRIVQTNYGVGYVPSRSTADITFQCPHCGNYGPESGPILLGLRTDDRGWLIEIDAQRIRFANDLRSYSSSRLKFWSLRSELLQINFQADLKITQFFVEVLSCSSADYHHVADRTL